MSRAEAEGRPTSSERRWWVEPQGEDEAESDEPASAGGERLVHGAETGLRWGVQSVALLLWAPLGLLFWLPLLLRRTVAYVLAVLRSGLTGSEVEAPRRRWEESVHFYRVGFLRIVHAFGDAERFPDRPGPDEGSLAFELLWSAAVWTALLWLTGLWADAPAAIGGAVAGGLEATMELVRAAAGRIR